MPVGADALEAQRQRNARLDYDEIKRLQGTVPVQTQFVVPITPKRSLAEAVEEWRNETEANSKRMTYLAYTKSSEYFLQFCTKATVPALYVPHEVKKGAADIQSDAIRQEIPCGLDEMLQDLPGHSCLLTSLSVIAKGCSRLAPPQPGNLAETVDIGMI